MKSFDSLRSMRGFVSGSAKGLPPPMSRSSSDSSLGSFANLKLTAEKLVKEQASMKADLEMAVLKLKKSAEQFHLLELKLQDATNENAKLKVKQKEDSKLWKGLDSKLSSTKTLCDQLTETLQFLAGQARAAEDDKKFFEEKFLANLNSLDELNSRVNEAATKLKCTEENIRKGKQELAEVKQEKEELLEILEVERHATENLKKDKDAVIQNLQDTIQGNNVHLQAINSELQQVLQEVRLKESTCKCLEIELENLEKDKRSLQFSNDDFAKKLLDSTEEKKKLEDMVYSLMFKTEELEKHSIGVEENLTKLLSSVETCNELAQHEKDLASTCAKVKFEDLHSQYLTVKSASDSFKTENEILKIKLAELQKAQEFIVVQHAEECRLSEAKVRKWESEAETLFSMKNDLEICVTSLEEKLRHLSDSSKSSEDKMQDLLLKISGLELENQELQEKMQSILQEKVDKIESLQHLIAEHELHMASLENQMTELHSILDEKEHINIQLREKQKLLEEQILEIQASLASAECNLAETKKHYDQMLEIKQSELVKHLKEISLKNDQAVNDIRKKYDIEKLEIVKVEKEKAEMLIRETERKCDGRVSENTKEARKYLEHVKEEHAARINQIQQEHEYKEQILMAQHKQELQRIQEQSENDLRERTELLKREHEIQIISLRHKHEDEREKLQEQLEQQHSKEEKQRALLQLQWKVMDQKSQQEDLEVTSKKEPSISSIKMRDTHARKGSQQSLVRSEKRRKDLNLSEIMRTPVANMLRKVENVNTGSMISIPKHSRKVTHHEYEVQTTNGKTITKRRKTKSTVMFGDTASHERVKPVTPLTRKDTSKATEARPHPSNIGDLFSEGSLNPYTDDPYAFD